MIFVKDPANPTGPELAAAIERGLAAGTLILAEDFLVRVRNCQGCPALNYLEAQPSRRTPELTATQWGAQMWMGAF